MMDEYVGSSHMGRVANFVHGAAKILGDLSR